MSQLKHLENPEEVEYIEELTDEEREIIKNHDLISISNIDVRSTPIYDVNDIDLEKIRISKPIDFKEKINVYLLYPIDENKYSRFLFETPFSYCGYGLDSKKNKYNKNDTYWLKVEYINHKNIANDDFKTYDFFQYIAKYLNIKLKQIYDSTLEHMIFLRYSKYKGYPLTRFMFNYRKHFLTECLDNTGRRITPYEIPNKVNIKFLLDPLEIWSNDALYGGTWRIKKLMVNAKI